MGLLLEASKVEKKMKQKKLYNWLVDDEHFMGKINPKSEQNAIRQGILDFSLR